MRQLLDRLAKAILCRNPGLSELLQSGLPVDKIARTLSRAGVKGETAPLHELYSWYNGTVLHGQSAAFKIAFAGGFVPPSVRHLSKDQKEFLLQYGIKRDSEPVSYHFIQLDTAVLHFKGFLTGAKNQPAWSVITARFFPFLWDGSDWHLALDLDPNSNCRVVIILTKEQKPLRFAYPTFEAFLEDAIRANETKQLLTCVTEAGVVLDVTNVDRRERDEGVGGESNEEGFLFIRNNFESDSAWQALITNVQSMGKRFTAPLRILSERKFDGVGYDSFHSMLGATDQSIVFVADKAALESSDRSILVLNLRDLRHRFRVALSALPEIESNLSTGNMDFQDFESSVDSDGVFRKFPKTG
jgi:hypothetical protein